MFSLFPVLRFAQAAFAPQSCRSHSYVPLRFCSGVSTLQSIFPVRLHSPAVCLSGLSAMPPKVCYFVIITATATFFPFLNTSGVLFYFFVSLCFSAFQSPTADTPDTPHVSLLWPISRGGIFWYPNGSQQGVYLYSCTSNGGRAEKKSSHELKAVMDLLVGLF